MACIILWQSSQPAVKSPVIKLRLSKAVLLVQRYILARLRKHRFFNLTEANSAIATLLVDLNNKAFKKLPQYRPALSSNRALIAESVFRHSAINMLIWKVARVGPDYHVGH